jgi:hypothetical protein
MLLRRVCATSVGGFLSTPLLLLACLGGEGKQEWVGMRGASPLFFVKRGFLCIVFPKVSLLHLAGLGSEEVGKSGLSADWRSTSPRLEILEIRLFAALPPHRRLATGAIRGHFVFLTGAIIRSITHIARPRSVNKRPT